CGALLSLTLSFYYYGVHLHLHSFPTRRSSDLGADASTRCTRRSASTTTSSVDLNASTSWWGSFVTKPTVSVTRTVSPPGSWSRRVVASRVAKSRSSTSTPASVSRLSRVDLPALV